MLYPLVHRVIFESHPSIEALIKSKIAKVGTVGLLIYVEDSFDFDFNQTKLLSTVH